MTPPHIDLGRLKSLHVRMTAARLVQSVPLRDQQRKAEADRIFGAVAGAGDALALDGTQPLDVSVNGLAIALSTVLKPAAGSDAERLLAELAAFSCAICCCTICRGDRDHDNRVITQYGLCIQPLREMLDLLVALASEIYTAVAEDLPRPRVMLSTDHTHSDNHRGILGTHGMAGWHRVEEDSTGSWSVVGLTIRDQAFKWESFCSAFYQIMHEVFCHGFQGVAQGSAKRSHADPCCAWSEGWMDELAFRIVTETLSDRHSGLPSWVQSAAGDFRRAANDVHGSRFREGDRLQAHHVAGLKMACDGFETLRKVLSTGHEPVTGHRATLFSVKLNAMRLPGPVYRKIGTLLATLLIGDDQVVADVAALCSEFIYTAGFDGVELLERLLAMMPAEAA
jgi:hypothetical protein